MVTAPKKIAACDAETDPFLAGRVPMPFIWGFYDGRDFLEFNTTKEFVEFIREKRLIIYAHNGGKFDFMYLIPFLGETKAQIINGRIVSIMIGKAELRDSFAAVPQALGTIQKKEIQFWKLEKNVRAQHMTEIREYLFFDCKYLYDLMDAYRKRAGSQKTIAGNALAYAKKIGCDPGKTNHRFDVNFRPYYFGGRTECFQPGTHKDITVLDIHSAYPYAMTMDHATGNQTDFTNCSTIDHLTREEIQRAFITLECSAKGCFPIRAGGANGLSFPTEYHQFRVTGWEYVAAKELGLISDIKIQSVHYSDKKMNFKPYVDDWFQYKADHSATDENGNKLHPIEYTIGKIMMNSLYGKFAQNPARYNDYRVVAAGSKICYDIMPGEDDICVNCGEKDTNHGWNWAGEFDHIEIHSRESLWKWKHQYGVEWQGKQIYKNVATGASVTGFCRAYLLRAIHAVGLHNVIYVDTDSLIVKSGTDLSGLPISEALGDWGIEEAGAPVGHFAGKKLYGIQRKKGKPKLASKGARLTFQDMEKLVKGEAIQWENSAPSFSLLSGKLPRENISEVDKKKLFMRRSIRSTAKN